MILSTRVVWSHVPSSLTSPSSCLRRQLALRARQCVYFIYPPVLPLSVGIQCRVLQNVTQGHHTPPLLFPLPSTPPLSQSLPLLPSSACKHLNMAVYIQTVCFKCTHTNITSGFTCKITSNKYIQQYRLTSEWVKKIWKKRTTRRMLSIYLRMSALTDQRWMALSPSKGFWTMTSRTALQVSL